MNEFSSAGCAAEIVRLRRDGLRLERLPEALTPPDLTAAYAAQDAVRVLWQQPVMGWKIGATALPVQAKFGLTQPFAGPFFGPDSHTSPATLAASRFHHRAIECEFAFRFGRTLPPRGERYTRDQIVAAIDALVPAIEIVGTRFTTLLFDAATTAIADCALNVAFVLGAPVAEWRHVDLAAHPVRLHIDGKMVVEGTGANVLGHPLTVLEWALDHFSGRGIAIEAGQIISTGTTTGIVVLEAGQTACADFGSLGKVELQLT